MKEILWSYLPVISEQLRKLVVQEKYIVQVLLDRNFSSLDSKAKPGKHSVLSNMPWG